MAEMTDRLQRAIEELSGNEALLEMLDTEAALEMLNWGIATARSIVARKCELDDFTADLALSPRLKALRQSMRSIGNWAAGKYEDPASRIELRDRLLGHFSTIFLDERPLPPPEKVDEVLSTVDDTTNTPRQLVQNLTQLIEEPPQA